jgi:hypothetical protein
VSRIITKTPRVITSTYANSDISTARTKPLLQAINQSIISNALSATMKAQFLGLLSLLAIPNLVQAKCQLHNQIEDDERGVETNEDLCKKQGEGDWSFTLDISEVGVPTFDGDNAFAGISGNSAFILYDNDCNRLGVYGPDNEGNDCGTPYQIVEDFLDYEIIITSVFLDVGDPDFTYEYGAGAYMIGENDDECHDMSSGLYAHQGCRTHFPLNGDGSN